MQYSIGFGTLKKVENGVITISYILKTCIKYTEMIELALNNINIKAFNCFTFISV